MDINLKRFFYYQSVSSWHDETTPRTYNWHHLSCRTTGNPGQANYAAAKAGMVGMSKALAQEVASRGVTVNCVAPGFIATPMTDVLPDEQKATLTAAIPAGRLGSGNDIAAAVLYLASDEAEYVTGQTLHVNGGMAMI